jgi:hypothetical protein
MSLRVSIVLAVLIGLLSLACTPATQAAQAAHPGHYYRVNVTTGNINNAGTDANVYITISGIGGSSGERRLDTPHDDFERGNTGSYYFKTGHLGTLRHLRIRHDNSGSAPGWFLERIVVTDLYSGRTWTFNAHRWLARDEGDQRIDITLFA